MKHRKAMVEITIWEGDPELVDVTTYREEIDLNYKFWEMVRVGHSAIMKFVLDQGIDDDSDSQ